MASRAKELVFKAECRSHCDKPMKLAEWTGAGRHGMFWACECGHLVPQLEVKTAYAKEQAAFKAKVIEQARADRLSRGEQ
jgi:hypothetical protein